MEQGHDSAMLPSACGCIRTYHSVLCLEHLLHVANSLPACAPPCHRAIVLLRGKDRQFWAGHYGSKFASAELRFLRRDELPAFGAEASQQFWNERKIAQTVEGLFGGPDAGAVVVWGQHGMAQDEDEFEDMEEHEDEDEDVMVADG
jgi:hypothetical protein